MRIFLTGAQGVGKSTLNKIIAEEYNLESIDSMSKKFIADKTIYKKIDGDEYMDMQFSIAAYAMDIYLNQDNIVGSRTVTDLIAFVGYAKDQTNKPEYSALLDYLNVCDRLVNSRPDTYVFYLPIEFDIADDNPLRSMSKEFQHEVDNRIQSALTNIKYTTLTGTVEQRMKTIRSTIGAKQ
jgi:adenylate kinase family enzyme